MPSLGELVAPRRLGTSFRWLLGSSWTSNLGDGIALSAAPLLIASMTSSPVLVAAGAMMQYLPWLLFGLFAGSVADHHDRRRLVMIANGSRAVVVAALVGFLVTGFSAYSALDKRVTVMEQQAVAVVERNREKDASLKDSLLELKSDIKDLQRSVNDVNRTLSTPRPKP